MMWRWTVLALVAANGGFWLWSHGELRALGWGPIEVAEPGRLTTQIQADKLRLTPQEPTAALAPEAVRDALAAPSPAAPPLAPPDSPPTPSSVSTPASPPVSSPTQGK
jgi:hypothetical protein